MPDVQFSFRGLTEYTSIVERWSQQLQKELGLAMRDIATEWQRQAKLRVPVDTGLTRNTILKDYGKGLNGEFYCAVGSNQKHVKYIEFGTDRIAGGRVKALGTRHDVTDTEAIHVWKAKIKDMTAKTAVQIDKSGGTKGARRNYQGRFVKNRGQEQMPWLRPAFMAIQEKVMGRLAKALFLK